MDARTRVTGNDEGVSSIIGFLAGLIVFTGSLALVAYYVSTAPEEASTERSQQLSGAARRATATLTETPGEPKNWNEKSPIPDKIERMGLLEHGTVRTASLDKIQHIQDGNITHSDMLKRVGLFDDGYSMRAEGRLVNVPLVQPPGATTHGVAHATDASTDSQLNWNVVSHSETGADRYAKFNPDYSYDRHEWRFSETERPANGLGNTVPDHAFFVETQLIPRMAGIAATDTVADHQTNDQWTTGDAREDLFEMYDNGDQSFNRWHVVDDGNPCEVPPSASALDDGEQVLGVGYRDSSCNWLSRDGVRSTALLGGFDAGTAERGNLTFDHVLDATDSDTTECPDSGACVAMNTSILFWNTTKTTNQWTRLNSDPKCGSQNWDGENGNEDTGGSWITETVNLCEAAQHSDGTVWLALFWDASCQQGSGLDMRCPTPNPVGSALGSTAAERHWFVDDVSVEFDGEQVWSTDLEPATDGRRTVFVSSQVDYTRTHAPAEDHAENNTMQYIRHAVENGTSVVALGPDGGNAGEWLAGVGLGAKSVSSATDIDTDKPLSAVMQLPNDLPEGDDDYQVENLAFEPSPPTVPLTGQEGTSLHGLDPLDVVQTDPNDDAVLLHGTPLAHGGRVVATAYDHDDFSDTQLRDDLLENLHTSAVFLDPSFEIGPEPPDSGTEEVFTGRTVLLVPISEDEQWTATIEVTTWVWPEAVRG
jgi:hypothetical protein